MSKSHNPYTIVFSSSLDALAYSMRHNGVILTGFPYYYCSSWFDTMLTYDITQPMTKNQRDELIQLVKPLGDDVQVYGGNLTPRWVGVEIGENLDDILKFVRNQKDNLVYAVHLDWLLFRPEPTVHGIAHVEATDD